jgi:hypothetical protein
METKKNQAIQLRPYQFKKGVSGNPEGARLKKNQLPISYQKQLREINPQSGRMYADDIAEVIVKSAAEGDIFAVMTALSNDTKNLILAAAERLCEEAGGTAAQARYALSLFTPKGFIING